jgi:hypothetical protein
MTTDLHTRLIALALELTRRGDQDLAAWIQKWIAHEQRESKKRPRQRGVKVKLAATGRPAVLPLVRVNEALKQAENKWVLGRFDTFKILW